ncbi:26229_t:CDS:2, partial [Racocetra persica]
VKNPGKKCKGGKVNEIRCTECEKKKKCCDIPACTECFKRTKNKSKICDKCFEKKDKVSQGSDLLYGQMIDTVIEGEQYLTYDENNFLIEISYIFE